MTTGYRAWLITKGGWVHMSEPIKSSYAMTLTAAFRLVLTWEWKADRHIRCSVMAIEHEGKTSFVSLTQPAELYKGDTLHITKEYPAL